MNRKGKYPFSPAKILAFLFVMLISIPCLKSEVVSASDTLTAYVLKTGTEQDLEKAPVVEFASNGTNIFTLNVEHSGCLLLDVRATHAKFVNIEVHKKSDCSDLPTYMSAQCTDYKGNRDIVEKYIEKGTYYLKFPENTYKLKALLYSNDKQTIKSNGTLVAYCDYYCPAIATYKATKNGYITIEQNWIYGGTMGNAENSVSLCDAKGKALSDAVCDHHVDEPVIFPVKKGKTYNIKITNIDVDGKQFYQMKLKFTAREDKAGSSKSKAKSLSLGKSTSGLAYVEDKTSKVHWYKFKNTKAQKLNIKLSGEASSGSIKVLLYDSKNKKIGSYHIAPGPGKSYVYTLQKKGKDATIPKGTYYIKLVKTQKTTSGIYTINVEPKKK